LEYLFNTFFQLDTLFDAFGCIERQIWGNGRNILSYILKLEIHHTYNYRITSCCSVFIGPRLCSFGDISFSYGPWPFDQSLPITCWKSNLWKSSYLRLESRRHSAKAISNSWGEEGYLCVSY